MRRRESASLSRWMAVGFLQPRWNGIFGTRLETEERNEKDSPVGKYLICGLTLCSAVVLFAGLGKPTFAQAPSEPPPPPKPAEPSKPAPDNCLSQTEAALHPDKEICVRTHVYQVVELENGVRFLDVCPPEQSDELCQFTLVSLPGDRDEVGDLRQYRDQDVAIRGILRRLHGRFGMVLSHRRQFHGGPEKFRPNPKLLQGFQGDSARPPVRDPNLHSGGHHRSFMNTRETEPLPKRK